MTDKASKRRRGLRWLAYGLLIKLALFGGAWVLAAGSH